MASGTASAQVPVPDLAPGGGGTVPFRAATQEKVIQLTAESFTAATTLTRIKRVAEGNGYIYGIVLDVVGTTAANALAADFSEDAPWNALDSVVLNDSQGELINLSGFDLFVANIAGRQYVGKFQDSSASLFTLTTGAGATGGSIGFMIRVPVGLNRRSLSGMVGNQDRGTKYDLRTDFAASTVLWKTSPTTLPPITITKFYEYYTLPNEKNSRRQSQQQQPDDYGKLHFITSGDFEAAPSASATKNHYLRRIGNTIRFIALIFRDGAIAATAAGNVRALAETAANNPTSITFKIGDDTIYQDTWRYRKMICYERYGFDLPDGVLIYDMLHDFGFGAGGEVGDDYLYTQGLNNGQFIIAYPSGFSGSNPTLHHVTDDLQEVA